MGLGKDIASILMVGNKICPHCQKRIPEKATICPYCQSKVFSGRKFEEQKTKKELESEARFEMGCVILIVVPIIALFVYVMLFYNK